MVELQEEEPVEGEAVKKRPKKTVIDDDDVDEEESSILTGLDPSGQYEAQRLPKGNLEQIRPRL